MDAWVKISARLSCVLPSSLLSMSIQQHGYLDILLRCIEDEYDESRINSDATQDILASHYQKMMSEIWIITVYETFRTIVEIEKPPPDSDLAILAHHLRLIRIPLAKHQIARDDRLDEPLKMVRYPQNNDDSDFVDYGTGNRRNEYYDPKRAHIMRSGTSARGSCIWEVIDGATKESFWLERRELSERILKIYGPLPDPA